MSNILMFPVIERNPNTSVSGVNAEVLPFKKRQEALIIYAEVHGVKATLFFALPETSKLLEVLSHLSQYTTLPGFYFSDGGVVDIWSDESNLLKTEEDLKDLVRLLLFELAK